MMKRKLLVLIIMLGLVSIACDVGGIFGQEATMTPPPALPSATATAEEMPTAQFTNTPETIATLPPLPTEEPVMPFSEYFRDEFDSDSGMWEYLYVIGNTQEQCEEPYYEDGSVHWSCPQGEEAQLRIYETNYSYTDIIVQAEVENLGSNSAAYSLLCRVSDLGWYEFRITANGLYEIFRFDWSLKDAGQNPYIYIGNGATIAMVPGRTVNTLTMDCSGEEFKFYVNAQEIDTDIPLSNRDEYLVYDEGGIGFGMMSKDTATADMMFHWIESLESN